MTILSVRDEKPVEPFVPKLELQKEPQPDLRREPRAAVVKVVGAGGGGSNAVNRMIESGDLLGVQFIAVNTDVQDLYGKSKAEVKLQIGEKLTGGRGAGGRPDIGEEAANEDRERIAEALRGADMVFVTAGMGGGTGTGSAPVIAKIARDMGALTVAVITKPFGFEGGYKLKLAEEGIEKLRQSVDSIIIIQNQNLFKLVERSTPIKQAYLMADDVLRQGVKGISEIIAKLGLVNPDFADVAATMRGQGDAVMGIGLGTGENRAQDAAESAIDNPLLEDTNVAGATRLLVYIAGNEDLTLVEVDEAINAIRSKIDKDAQIIHAVRTDPELGGDIQVTVIATGFGDISVREAQPETASPKKEDSDFIKYDTFAAFREHTQRPDYLPQRDYQDDLEVPTVLRRHDYQSAQREKKASDGRDA